MVKKIEITVNSETFVKHVAPNRVLLDFLREDLGMTGTKKGCETGDCGACTVIANGKSVCSCLSLAVEMDGAVLLTIEGLATGDGLHPIQQAFVDHGGFQCGYCTPGMILSTHMLLSENPAPTDLEMREGIAGNLCRCTGYKKIFESIRAAADARTKNDSSDSTAR